jgi:hypothetical protein
MVNIDIGSERANEYDGKTVESFMSAVAVGKLAQVNVARLSQPPES